MIRALVLYPNAPGERFDFDYYFNRHLPLCQSLGDPAGVTFRADRGIAGIAPGSPAPFLAVAVIECASVEVLQTFLAAHGATLMADIPNYTSVQPVIQIGERVA